MTTKRQWVCAIAGLIALALAPVHAQNPSPPAKPPASAPQPSFATPEEAVNALVAAVRAGDRKAVAALMGPDSESWLFSGDRVSDRREWSLFLAAYEKKHGFAKLSDRKMTLVIGEDQWAFPAPLVKKSSGWTFDGAAGREEVTNRRVGRNELDTIETLLAVVDAQREYAAADSDGNGFNDYARRFVSSKGKKDGLYWPVKPGERPSPLGPLVAEAAAEGYGKGKQSGEPRAYHGYRYHLLTAQGRDAPGGAYNYLVKDKLIGGFAVVAYPARYGVSGVMTFMVNHDGVVYQKDLGPDTASSAAAMKQFNPDKTWTKARQVPLRDVAKP
jgi:hypothetical protein